jgi:hypothetical protein
LRRASSGFHFSALFHWFAPSPAPAVSVLAGGGWSAVAGPTPVAGVTVAAGVVSFNTPTGVVWTPANGGSLFVHDKNSFVRCGKEGCGAGAPVVAELRLPAVCF